MSQTWIFVVIGLLAGLLAGVILDYGSRWYLESKTSSVHRQSKILWVTGIKLTAVFILFFLIYRWVPLLLGTGAGILIEKQWYIFNRVRALKKAEGKVEK
ncbi:MAG TPA: hypothetical protein DIT32_06185 [Peptococcaceae bacterium]|nr:hypothetical protein [Peptococcaceae bacterium]